MMPSAGGVVTRLLAARVHASGIELAPLLSKAGLTSEQIDNPVTRVRVESQIRFLELGAAALGDDLLGFHLARDFDLRKVGLLYYVLASSDSLPDAMEKAERYCAIANEGILLKFRGSSSGAAIMLSYRGVQRRSDRHQIEFWLTSLIRLCRQLTNRKLLPNRIGVAHRRPKTPGEMKSFMGCQIEFGCDVDEVVFSERARVAPIISADPYLNKLLTSYCEEALLHRGEPAVTLRSSLENEIAQLLPHGEPRAEAVARRLGMSQRTLTRRLSSEGLSFARIMDELKSDLATRYLRERDLTISKIAWLLGYGENSAFTHAFRRWTGMTPNQFRGQRDVGCRKT
jgi:AraC-like DNA-binding protein